MTTINNHEFDKPTHSYNLRSRKSSCKKPSYLRSTGPTFGDIVMVRPRSPNGMLSSFVELVDYEDICGMLDFPIKCSKELHAFPARIYFIIDVDFPTPYKFRVTTKGITEDEKDLLITEYFNSKNPM